MKKIDSYILKKYLNTFFFCLLLFTLIVVVIDLSEKTDDFVKSHLSFWQIVNQYYIGFIPHLDAMLFPLFVFISVIFFTSKMAERVEVVAILSAGVSFRRFLRPYWIGGILLALFLWVGNHFVLPKANTIWGDFLAKYVDINYGMVSKPTENYYFRVDSNSYAGIRYYDTTSKTGNNFFIEKFSGNQLKYNVRAESITWDASSNKWRLMNAMEHTFVGNKQIDKKSTSLLQSYSFSPMDLRKDDYIKDRLTTPQLNEFIRMEKLRGSETVGALLTERYSRDAIPVSVIILTLIGAILSSKKVRGGSGAHLAIGVVISLLYILASRFAIVFATKGNFPPLLAAWVPNIIFGALAFYLYKKAPK